MWHLGMSDSMHGYPGAHPNKPHHRTASRPLPVRFWGPMTVLPPHLPSLPGREMVHTPELNKEAHNTTAASSQRAHTFAQVSDSYPQILIPAQKAAEAPALQKQPLECLSHTHLPFWLFARHGTRQTGADPDNDIATGVDLVPGLSFDGRFAMMIL